MCEFLPCLDRVLTLAKTVFRQSATLIRSGFVDIKIIVHTPLASSVPLPNFKMAALSSSASEPPGDTHKRAADDLDGDTSSHTSMLPAMNQPPAFIQGLTAGDSLLRHGLPPTTVSDLLRRYKWEHITDISNTFDSEQEAMQAVSDAAEGQLLTLAWTESDTVSARQAAEWININAHVVHRAATYTSFKLDFSKGRGQAHRRRLLQTTDQVRGEAKDEQTHDREMAFKYATAAWSITCELQSGWHDDLQAITDSATKALFVDHRLAEFAVFEWTYIRAAIYNINDFREWLCDHNLSIDLNAKGAAPPLRIHVEEYLKRRAAGDHLGTGSKRGRRGGPSVGRTVGHSLKWWMTHARITIPDFKIPPPPETAERVPKTIKQAVPLSIAICVHIERWSISSNVGAAILAGGATFMTHAVLRFKHGMRTRVTSIQDLCMPAWVFKGKRGANRRGYQTYCPTVGISGTDWAQAYYGRLQDYNQARGSAADFLIPIMTGPPGSFTLGSTAMPYAQFRTMFAALLEQAPLQLDRSAAVQLTGHSMRRMHTTVCGIRRCTEAESNALANWIGTGKSEITNMPIRYRGARNLTQVGVKMESIAACKWCVEKVGPTAKLDWPTMQSILDSSDTPDFRTIVSDRLKVASNPLGDEDPIDIYQLPIHEAESESEVKSEAPALTSDAQKDTYDASESDSSSDDDVPEVTTSTSEPAPASHEASSDAASEELSLSVIRLAEIRKIIGTRSIKAHCVRQTVHIMRSDDPMRTACGEDTSKWPAAVDLQPTHLVEQFWPLCSKPSCFKAAHHFSDAMLCTQRKSGRPTLIG